MTAPVVTLTDSDIIKRKQMMADREHLEARLGGVSKRPQASQVQSTGLVYP